MGVGLASERIWLFRDILGYFAPVGRHGERIGGRPSLNDSGVG